MIEYPWPAFQDDLVVKPKQDTPDKSHLLDSGNRETRRLPDRNKDISNSNRDTCSFKNLAV